MPIKLVKASYEYQDLIVDMLKEWIDYNNNHPEANTSPASIFKNDYHNFDYYIINLIGHGSIIMWNNMKQFHETIEPKLNYIKRSMPEYMKEE